jgi:hypothetical protein
LCQQLLHFGLAVALRTKRNLLEEERDGPHFVDMFELKKQSVLFFCKAKLILARSMACSS